MQTDPRPVALPPRRHPAIPGGDPPTRGESAGMHTIEAEAIYIVEGVEDEPRARARVERMMPFVHSPRVERVDDAGLAAAVDEHRLNSLPRHGMSDEVPTVVIFNRFRFDDPPELQAARREQHPQLFVNPMLKLSGYGGYDWRDSGSPEHRRKTRAVCQPAWQLHSIVGCPFRCAYCGLGRMHNVMTNMEEFVERLDGFIGDGGGQTLYQYDNYSDVACFEPEYGGSRLLVEHFAERPGTYLELYVGKSDNVDYLLDLDHRGKTVCCWSVAGPTQCDRIERGAASMEARLQAAKRCQEAGYAVRFRFSPIVPVSNWREEYRELIQRLFALTRPDLITFETLRYLNYEALCTALDTGILDEALLESVKSTSGTTPRQGCEIPDDFRREVYRFIIDELEAVSPNTPYALCREQRDTWEFFEEDFARHGQHPDRYVCNCGPTSSPDHPLCGAAGQY